ncbi:MAG TPA: 4Fe-4S dicluster domain-containing protein [Thermoanaerobaculia bacterium]|nr:4Fe-4S dicluster domain-containing protein [Thermoanaerobaculia bacterium]
MGDGAASPNQARHDYATRGETVGFLTDPTVCIGCKACEVACKEWNGVPDDGFLFSGDSYDHTGQLSGSTWRHVKFLEVDQALRPQEGPFQNLEAAGLRTGRGGRGEPEEPPFTWLFVSDVCKHCEVAGCLEACPTGAILRTELDTVYVQDDVCNGCGYCVVGCPFGVIDRRPELMEGAGGAFKCTFCYDRQSDGLTPACAKVCPTESILFGPLDELRERGAARVRELEARGYHRPALYDPRETSVRGIHALFILLGDPEPYGLPPRPESPTVHLESAWLSAFLCAVAALALTFGAFAIF